MTWVDWWGRRWVQTAAAILLLIYAILRIQIAVYDRKIRAGEAELARLRPVVLEAVQATESQATVAAQERFAEHLKASVTAWEPVFQRLASAIPPTMVVHTMGIDGTRLTLQGILRHPPADPQPYLAAVAAALKRQGVLQTATVAVGPRDVDDPSVIRVDVTGALQ